MNYANKESSSKDTEYIRDLESFDDLKVEGEVKRNLKARHISMIALGGTIGTGLFISTKNVISAGPVLALFAYLFIATLAWSVTQSLGEMATYIPVSGSFTQFSARFCSPALGVANGWNYWFSWCITFALEISVVGQVIQYWTHAVPLAAWISIFFVIITCSNMFPVKVYGEVEFWIASIKVIAVVGWLIYALCMVCGAGKTGPVGFRYWRHPGAWGAGADLVSNLNTDRFLAWLSSLISALFTFQGVELVGISCGETANPRKTVPAAIRKVIWRIMIFYVGCIFFMGLLIPYNDEKLNDQNSFAASSPFIVAMKNSGTKILPDIFNAVILMAIISAANSNVYSGSRILYGLGQAGAAPKVFTRTTKHGIPYVAVFSTAIFGALGYLVLSNNGNTVFNWLLNITAVAGLIAWVNISYSHIRFMRILKSRNISRDSLPFQAWGLPFIAYYGFILCFILVFVQGYSVFFAFNVSDFFVYYVSVILFAVTWLIAHIYFNGRNSWRLSTLLLPLDECDIDTGVRDVDEMVWDDTPPKNLWEKFWAFMS
ncbi:CIC11C00000005573 [Sungouiella intermedia]|uniref:CIC11C00000005573 n=1 Tax=Sungouiella intermedia TaxID=45354 RepID=A0A1L0BD67_9ASCO|nr:CIC11C00000005573 [[Candida] intermedia]